MSRLEYSARCDDIVGLNQFAEVSRLEAVGREPILREFQIDCLLLHASTLEQTLTSESKLRRGRLRIHLCANCAHVMSDAGGLDDVAGYYGAEYDSLLESAEADDLYDLDAQGQPIYRSQIQLDTLVRLANLPAKGRVLDFGCGKGGFLTRFQRQYPGWELHGCDVSERYRRLVEPVTGPGRFAVTSLERAEAAGAPFDLVTMLFVAEHLVARGRARRHEGGRSLTYTAG